ncbi:GAF domain-containing protein [Sphingomonas nostoxanthinifaciens]|uniref:GAF domain-containing protein n=1 Tax=Sphingomonas nostoxanthinifaciens TaxID=2872652 RepID=UPI001CC22037|nr:GAF domain-containing protein [Sphingomonas nostoxanthinifaciens]UAK24149.1 GAF domain-containing protein [Sphingomonas nostoxanthinifaciens]
MSLSFFSPPPLPNDEAKRQHAVDRSGILRAPPDPALQAIVARAADLFGSAIAAVSIVDRQRQWFAARIGLDAPETSRAVSFCAHAILDPQRVMVIEDATLDDRFAGNPLVTGAPAIRFYAGASILDPRGRPLGALCAIDPEPRSGTLPLDELAALAGEVAAIIAEIGTTSEA